MSLNRGLSLSCQADCGIVGRGMDVLPETALYVRRGDLRASSGWAGSRGQAGEGRCMPPLSEGLTATHGLTGVYTICTVRGAPQEKKNVV
jgi:hypothetical protein